MKVRIVTAFTDCWYYEQIGSTFNVRKGLGLDDKPCYYFDTNHESNYIRFEDCEIITEENQPEPFDLERALKGEKVITRNGLEVTEVHYFKTAKSCIFSIGAVIMGDLHKFGDKGNFMMDGEHHLDLFMAHRPSEYVTKWVNLYDERVTDNTIRCSSAYHSKERAIETSIKYTNESVYIGTFPITYKRPK